MKYTVLNYILIFIHLQFCNSLGLCDTLGTFNNEMGQFSLSWCFPTTDEIQITFTLNSTEFIAIGFGG